jgi:uncharacterized protein YcfJ
VNLLKCRQYVRKRADVPRLEVAMTKLWLPALVLASMAFGVCAQDARYSNGDDNARYGWADVLRADPVPGVTRTEVPRQECYEQPVVRHEGGNSAVGTVLGAVIGGVLGNTVGKGDGRKAATVVGAVAGGVVGNQVGKRSGGETTAWRIVVRLDNGQYATVTQRENPGLRNGDYAEVRGDHVYAR